MAIPPDPNNNVPAVQTFALTRVYGPMVALNALNLTVNRGDLFGFIGSNGAGKTTTLRVLATFLAPSPLTAQVLLLDEPASGLDPRARIEMMAILEELQKMGKTVIISSHILSELETLCNRVAIIEKGKLIYTGPAQGMRDQMAVGRVFWVKIIGDDTRAVELLKARPEVNQVEHTEGRLKVMLNDHETDPGCVAETLVHGGVQLIGMEG